MDSFGYRFFFLLHIASIVVAFAPAVVALLPAGDASATLRAFGRTVYAPALLLAGLFGIVLIILSDEVWEFSQTWTTLAFLVWIAMNGVFHAFVLPGKRIGGGRPARSAAVDVQSGEAILTVLFVVMLWLMIWKPGL